jgi:hypothetical protein
MGAEGDVEFPHALGFAAAKVRMLGELVCAVQDKIDGPVGRRRRSVQEPAAQLD